jgi:hypothetical protein
MILLLSPFIINCFFAYPQTDDFCYSNISRSMGFFNTQYHVYTTWSGRFTSTILLSVNPLVYNFLAGYKLVFAIFILAQLTSIYVFIDAVTEKTLSRQETLIFALTLLFAYFDQMDDVRSGLYWMAGVITYQVAETLLILYFALIFFMNQDHKYDNLHNKCVVIILAILLGGTNEIVLALVLLITAILIFYSYSINKIIKPFQVVTFAAVAIGSSIGLMAPGNFARLSGYHERKDLFVTAWNAFNRSLASMEVWITSPLTLVLMCMVLFAVIRKPQIKILFGGFKIINSACLLLSLTFLCFFIPFWSTGMPPENRVLNMIYLFFLIGWMINLAIIFAHFGETIFHLMKKIPIKTGFVIVAVYMIALFSLGTSNFILVTKDLLSGASFRYNEEMKQRASQIINSDKDNCALENITSTPDSLYFYFIGPDEKYWVNGCYATYFGKKSAVLSKKTNCRN